MMRTGRFLTILSILLLGIVLPAAAQRTRRPTPRPTPKPTPYKPIGTTPRPTAGPVVAAAKQLVANQLYNVNEFIDRIGAVAVSIETIDKEAKTNRRIKKETVDTNEANKKKALQAIRNMRQGLLTLETDFRTKPQLSKYLVQIQGISTLCAQSEDHWIAGRYVTSKDPLRQVVQKLTATMAVMP